jgi:dTDP-4-dehydrorhamnose 3,5-epimerase
MRFSATRIPEVILVEPELFSDERGFFMETWHRSAFAQAGIDVDFVQDNHSRSQQGTLRGLHYQILQPQGKLVRATRGEIFDVAVDMRRRSPTFGCWVGERLSDENRRMLWIPPGFAHGFYVTSAVAEVQYKCTDNYAPEHERCVRWDDPEIGIAWPLRQGETPLLSAKDSAGDLLSEADVYE